jgi:hypothetical protein
MTSPVDIRIIRSKDRKKTIQARRVGGVVEVRAPAHMTDAQLQPHVDRLVQRLARRAQAMTADDGALQRRAEELNRTYFEGKLHWTSIRWVINQEKRYGSCTPADGTIRISARVASLPRFVQDYVIVHELAHLAEANHGPRFWKLANRYPRAERARGYLMALGLEEVEPESPSG